MESELSRPLHCRLPRFHANGEVAQMEYGNDYLYSATQTTSAPYQRLERAMSVKTDKPIAIDESFSYTARGRIASITDHKTASYSRDFIYDGAGRLTGGSGDWGQTFYSYDALGNLRTKNIGERTVTNDYDETTHRLTVSHDSELGDRYASKIL